MSVLKFRSTGQEVHLLKQILVELGYDIQVSEFFGKDTDKK